MHAHDLLNHFFFGTHMLLALCPKCPPYTWCAFSSEWGRVKLSFHETRTVWVPSFAFLSGGTTLPARSAFWYTSWESSVCELLCLVSILWTVYEIVVPFYTLNTHILFSIIFNDVFLNPPTNTEDTLSSSVYKNYVFIFCVYFFIQ